MRLYIIGETRCSCFNFCDLFTVDGVLLIMADGRPESKVTVEIR